MRILANNCPTPEQIAAETNPGEVLRMRYVLDRVIDRCREIERAGREPNEAEQAAAAEQADRSWRASVERPGTLARKWATDPKAAKSEVERRAEIERAEVWVEINARVAPADSTEPTSAREFRVRDRSVVARARLAEFLGRVPPSLTGFEVRVTCRPAQKTEEEDKREQKRVADLREAVRQGERFGYGRRNH